jgi:hypothetical protein
MGLKLSLEKANPKEVKSWLCDFCSEYVNDGYMLYCELLEYEGAVIFASLPPENRAIQLVHDHVFRYQEHGTVYKQFCKNCVTKNINRIVNAVFNESTFLKARYVAYAIFKFPNVFVASKVLRLGVLSKYKEIFKIDLKLIQK